MILALDFGGTKLSAAVFEPGETTWRGHKRVFSEPGTEAFGEIVTMIELANELLAGEEPAAIGVSFGGPVDFAAGKVRLSHHVPGWEDTPLREIFLGEFMAPTAVDNDANVAALGEYRFGAGRGYDSLLYITVSTGVGGGWILDGRPWRGAEGMAGEIGHMVVDPAGPLCLCGKRGCVERLASGPFMAEGLREAWREEREGREWEVGDWRLEIKNEEVTGKLVAEAAGRGDGAARRVLERGAWALGVGIGNTANLVNPRRFILGGGVTKSGEGWWQTVQRVARETAMPEVSFEIVPAVLGDDAPLWGAVALGQDLLNREQ